MSSDLASSSWYRFLLAPAMLALLIGGPIASMAASQYGISWLAVFLTVSGGLAIFWDLALHRDGDSRRPIATKVDPVFGPIYCFDEGTWEAKEEVNMVGAWLPVKVAAGDEGPSSEQQEAYREFLRDPAGFRMEMVKSLVSREGESTHPGLVPLGLFLPCPEDSEGPSMEIDVLVDGDERGPHQEVVGFRGGKALTIRAAPEPQRDVA